MFYSYWTQIKLIESGSKLQIHELYGLKKKSPSLELLDVD